MGKDIWEELETSICDLKIYGVKVFRIEGIVIVEVLLRVEYVWGVWE